MAEKNPSPGDALPLIGICAHPAGEAQAEIALSTTYVDRIREAGGIPVILPLGPGYPELASAYVAQLDGLLLTGGGDICPESFGGHPYAEGSKAPIYYLSRDRDDFEWAMVQAAWDADLPCLGICRGMQVLNVSRGGTIVRDVSELGNSSSLHARFGCGKQVAHKVTFEHGSKLRDILEADEISVNSMHHQAVKGVAADARITAWAPDGTPEGLEFDERTFFVGVQWHPEQICNTPALFEAFVEVARRTRAE